MVFLCCLEFFRIIIMLNHFQYKLYFQLYFLVIIGRMPILKFPVCGTCGSDNLSNEITSEMCIVVTIKGI